MNTATHYIHWFRDITVDDVPLVGGKNAWGINHAR